MSFRVPINWFKVYVMLETDGEELLSHPTVERMMQDDVREQRRNDSSKAIANFEFDAVLTYRRGERPHTNLSKRRTTWSDITGSM